MRTRFAAAMVCVTLLLAAPPARAQQDGIKLHGVWALEVRNPDGTVAGRTTFRNALTATGQGALTSLLIGQKQIATWIVTFNEPFITSPSDTRTPLCVGDGQCRVFVQNGPLASAANGTNWFATMSIASNGPQLVMSGTFTATRPGGGQIERVVTHVNIGVNGQLGEDRYFTMATLPTPMAVAEGQIVQFTYTVSFQ